MPTPLSEQSALGELDRAAGPAWIIDAAAARILAANAAGAGIFAVAGVLDAAMPAMARLRDIARGIEPVIAAERPLLFWTAAGPRVFECVIRLVERPCGRAALLVMSAEGDAPAGACEAARRAGGTSPGSAGECTRECLRECSGECPDGRPGTPFSGLAGG